MSTKLHLVEIVKALCSSVCTCFRNLCHTAMEGTTPGRMQGGGNRYVEGDLFTFGYLMLDDALGYPYFPLFNGNP